MITTASAANHAYLRGLGADEVIDYNARDFTAIGAVCDAVFDTVGDDVARKSFAVLQAGRPRRLHRLRAAGAGPDRSDVKALRPPVGRDRRHLDRIAELFLAGAIRAPEITLYPLSEAAAAHKVSESRHLRGKLVLQVR